MSPLSDLGVSQFVLSAAGPPANYQSFPAGTFSEGQFAISVLASRAFGNFTIDSSGYLICAVEGIYFINYSVNFGGTVDVTKFWGIQVYRNDTTSPIKSMITRPAYDGSHPTGNTFTVNENSTLTDYFFVGDQLHCLIGHDYATPQQFFVFMNLQKML